MGLPGRISMLIVLLIMAVMVCAQNSTSEETGKTFNKRKWKQLTEHVDYTDKTDKEKASKQININSLNWSKPSVWSTVLQYVTIIAVIGLLVFLMVRLFLQRHSINRKLKRDHLLIEEVKEEEQQPEFLQEKLLEAIYNADYAGAVRYYYLLLIIRLVNKKWIIRKKDKTNNDYLREMRNKPHFYYTFSELTQVFEKVIYGDIPVTKTSFINIQKKFDDFITTLNNK